jgi:hypothetical protein
LTDLERDRRLGLFNDLFTVGLLVSYIKWQLGRTSQADGDVRGEVRVAPVMVTR